MNSNTKIMEDHELSHVQYDKQSGRYSLDMLHVTLANATFAKELLKKLMGTGRRRQVFDSSDILKKENGHNFILEPIHAKTIELSTRFKFDEKTGMYLSAWTI